MTCAATIVCVDLANEQKPYECTYARMCFYKYARRARLDIRYHIMCGRTHAQGRAYACTWTDCTHVHVMCRSKSDCYKRASRAHVHAHIAVCMQPFRRSGTSRKRGITLGERDNVNVPRNVRTTLGPNGGGGGGGMPAQETREPTRKAEVAV